RTADTHMYRSCPEPAQLIADLLQGGSAHDRIVDYHDALALYVSGTEGKLLRHLFVALRLSRRYKRAADVMTAQDNRQKAAGTPAFAVSHSNEVSAVRHRRNDISLRRTVFLQRLSEPYAELR